MHKTAQLLICLTSVCHGQDSRRSGQGSPIGCSFEIQPSRQNIDPSAKSRTTGRVCALNRRRLIELLFARGAPVSVAWAHSARCATTSHVLSGQCSLGRRSTPVSQAGTLGPARFTRWRQALPGKRDALDKDILDTAIPSIVNLAVIPLVGAVDTFWVGRMGDALALAGQGAANQCFWSTWFLIAFIPTITAPLVAKAAGGGDIEGARARVCEALFLANVLGIIGTFLLVLQPSAFLSLVLPADADPALVTHATQYLRLRSLSLIPALVSSIGFAAFRGLLDTVTPLKVSLASNTLNLILDPIAIFSANMGVAGAALATAVSEVSAGALYVFLLMRRQLLRLGALLKPPKMSSLLPLVKGGLTTLIRQAAINIAFVMATRATQAMDSSGVSAAAYTITNQVYSLGLVVMLAMQATCATLVPAVLSRDGTVEARRVADRLIGWSTAIAACIAVLQALAVPYFAPLFSTLPEVRSAVVAPALASAAVQFINGPVFAGEGILMGVGAFGYLAGLTGVGCAVMIAGLTIFPKLGLGVSGVWFALFGFHVVQFVGTMYHHLKLGPLMQEKGSSSVKDVRCLDIPTIGEVCIENPSEQELIPATNITAAAAPK